jgi:hypothetical protein
LIETPLTIYSSNHMNTQDPDESKVVDADIVETPESPVANGANVLVELENMIKSHISGIDARKTELRKYRDMLTSALSNDETYQEHERLAKEAAKVKNATKQQLLKLPSNAQVAEKVRDLSIEVKEMDGALSDYLKEYERMSGTNEIQDDMGQVRQIVYVAKLVKASSRPK